MNRTWHYVVIGLAVSWLSYVLFANARTSAPSQPDHGTSVEVEAPTAIVAAKEAAAYREQVQAQVHELESMQIERAARDRAALKTAETQSYVRFQKRTAWNALVAHHAHTFQ